ncbi:hypothetical protein Btru_048613 [Bulinus truncatus]|nr:hypothetical protein Btru_048613 [Bulinus truncatus]
MCVTPSASNSFHSQLFASEHIFLVNSLTICGDIMGNGQSTPKGQHVQCTAGQPVLEYDGTGYSSISSGHYVSSRNLATLDALSTSSISHGDPDVTTKKTGKKLFKIKDKSSVKEKSVRDMFERESFDFNMDSPDFQKDFSLDVDFEETCATVSSPSVPEVTVDVLHADITQDSADGFSQPSISVDSVDVRFDNSSHNVSNITVNNYPHDVNVNEHDIYATVSKHTHDVNVNDQHHLAAVSKHHNDINVGEQHQYTVIRNHHDVKANNPSHDDILDNHHLEETNSDATLTQTDQHLENISTFTSDSGLHYPMIFRRSKKDPGSKQYNELVKELSTVLGKRANGARPHTIYDDSSVNELEQRIAQAKVDKHKSKSMDSLSNNVFSNKLLLSKLENHLISKNRSNQLINEERLARTENPGKSDISFHSNMFKQQDKSSTDSALLPESPSGRQQETLTYFNEIDKYFVPVPDKIVNISTNQNVNISTNQNVNISTNQNESNTKGSIVAVSGNKVTIKSNSVTTVSEIQSKLYDKSSSMTCDQTLPRDHSSNINSQQDRKNNNVYVNSVTPSFQADSMPYTSLHYTNSTYAGERSTSSHQHSSEHNNINHKSRDTAGYHSTQSGYYRNNSQDISPQTTSNVHISHYTPSSRHNRSFASRSNITSPPFHHTAYQHGNSSSRVTKIRIPGLLRNSSIMHSEPNLTQGISDQHNSSTADGNLNKFPSRPGPGLIPLHQNNSAVGNNNFYAETVPSGVRSQTTLGRTKSTSDLIRAVDTERTFNPNQSYDLIYFNEDDFTRSSYHSDNSSSGVSSPRSYGMRIIDSGGSTSSMDTYFKSAEGNSISLHANKSSITTSSARGTSVGMSTIVEQPGRSLNNNTAESASVAASSWSVFSLDQPLTGSFRAASTPETQKGSTRLYHSVDRRHQHRYHKNNRTNHRILVSRSDSSATSENSSSSHRSSSNAGDTLSNAQTNKSHVFIVVPPKTSKILIPDLIVDHNTTSLQHDVVLQNKLTASYVETNGSPFHQEISEGTLPTAHGEGLHRGEEDKPASFVIDARNLKGEPTVQVDGPNAIAKCSIDPQPDGQYRVTYIPVEVGLFDVYVRWNGKEIPGSPFHPKVVDSRKVKVIGGWHHYMDGQERIHLVVGEEKKIPFDTSEAGPGHMRAEVKSPSAFIPVEVDDEHKGKSVVKFVPKEEGIHHIHLYWSDHPLVNSPYVGFAVITAADPSKVWLSGQGLKEAVIREEAEFFIDGSQAGPGEPEIELTGVRAEIQVFKTPLGGGKYRCTYIPVIPGAYLLNISWNGRQLRGAPYKVNVIGASYPNRVVVNGEGLKGGLFGDSLDFKIDTRKAGPGELTAYCMGPSKVAYCELSDHHDGTYHLVVRPQEVGKHVLQIKYGGENVQGSPFAFKVSAQPDASKVRVSGPGVEHGILANFQSQFIVETKGAGAGQLTVRIRGPKGAFQVEMYRESQKDRTILCRYYPSVTGLYIINVRWSGVDVPGSPFHVQILDTQQELEQVLHDQSFSGSSHHHLGSHPSNSFHNTSLNSSSQLRYAGPHSGQQHNMSRSSGYYHQWREEL